MDNRLERIRKILAEQDNQQNKSNDRPSGFDAVFPFWNMRPGSSSTVRFLPDGNTKNALPWIESQTINLSFPGIVGQPNEKNVTVRVPCAETWNLTCPILGHIRKEKWFDDKDTEELGRKYWKKYSYIMQGFVVEDGLNEETTPENPIRRFIFGKQIFGKVRTGFMDPELEFSVDDYDEGIDFIIDVESSGSYNNYNQSRFKRKSRSLTAAEREAIETYGLNNLADFLPKQPTDEELVLLYDMFLASIEGEYYDPAKWGHLPWRPRGLESTEAPKTPKAESYDEDDDTPEVTVKPKVEEKLVEKSVEKSDDSKDDAKKRTADILAKIRQKS